MRPRQQTQRERIIKPLKSAVFLYVIIFLEYSNRFQTIYLSDTHWIYLDRCKLVEYNLYARRSRDVHVISLRKKRIAKRTWTTQKKKNILVTSHFVWMGINLTKLYVSSFCRNLTLVIYIWSPLLNNMWYIINR